MKHTTERQRIIAAIRKAVSFKIIAHINRAKRAYIKAESKRM